MSVVIARLAFCASRVYLLHVIKDPPPNSPLSLSPRSTAPVHCTSLASCCSCNNLRW